MTADRSSIHQTATIEHHEETIGRPDAWRKKAHYAGGVRCYVAKRGLWPVAEASRWPWLGYPRTPLTRNGVGLVGLKAGEAVAVGVITQLMRHGLTARPELGILRSVQPGDWRAEESAECPEGSAGLDPPHLSEGHG